MTAEEYKEEYKRREEMYKNRIRPAVPMKTCRHMIEACVASNDCSKCELNLKMGTQAMSEENNVADVATKRDVKAGDIYKLLMDKFSDKRQWLCAGEVSNCTGGGLRRLDFVAVNCYESQGYGIHAFEIKISKSDLRRELEDPSKHNIFFDWVDTYSICAPDYVLDAEYKSLIPPKWGIYTLSTRVVNDENSGEPKEERYLKTVRKPLNLHDEKDLEIKRSFAMALLRSIRNQNAERFFLQDKLNEEYERGKRDAICGNKYELERYKRMFEEEGWKLRFAEKLHIYSKERAEESIDKVQAMLAMYDEMKYLKNRIDTLVTATEIIKKVSDDFNRLMGNAEAKEKNESR